MTRDAAHETVMKLVKDCGDVCSTRWGTLTFQEIEALNILMGVDHETRK